MQLILKVGRLGTILGLLFSAFWAGNLAYMVHGWVVEWPHVIDALPEKASLSTNAVVGNWWVLWLFVALTIACAAIIILRREVPLLLAAIVAVILLLSVSVFNVMVVSTGFEMSALARQ